jgi:hypothetical protein
MIEDMEWLLSQVPYRGQVITTTELSSWMAQFPMELQPVALHLVRKIATDYYVGIQRYHESLDSLIHRSGIPDNGEVVFCRWQALGKSADRVANILKNQAGWKVHADLDLRQPVNSWPSLSEKEAYWFVLADDFIGSGTTVGSLFGSPESPIPRLLGRYPRARLILLVVAGFEVGIRRVRAEIARYRNRVEMMLANLWHDEDQCFHPASRVILDANQRGKLRAFCLHAAETLMRRLPPKFRLGYKEIAGVVVFHDSVPNNSLPILWHRSDKWQPLFPRSGLLRNVQRI